MEAIKIDRNSWHYKIAKLRYEPTNICDYRMAVIGGVLSFIAVNFIILAGIYAASFCVVHYILSVLWLINYHYWPHSHADFALFVVASTIIIVVLIATIVIFLHKKLCAVRNTHRTARPSIVKVMYLSWKEKHCSRVEFE